MSKKMLLWIFIVLLVGLLSLCAIDGYVKHIGKRSVVTFENVPKSKAAIVLGAYVLPDGSLCDMLTDRVKTAVELYKDKKVDKILMSGDHGRKSYDEVNNMRKYAESLGVPTQDIFMDHAGFSTYESMYRAKEIFKVDSAIVVTQKFHLPRALYIANKQGINAVGVEADKHIYAGAEIYDYREVPARIKAFLQAGVIHSKPTFLGEAIPISGDGRRTHDID